MSDLVIIGAGLAGLIAAHAFPRATVIEIEAAPREAHQALLRFRTDKVSVLTGIPFRRVVVRKGIWHHGRFNRPDIALANAYSQKCLGLLDDRSIWDISPAERFIAPENLYPRMISHVEDRIKWGVSAGFAGLPRPIVSTVPMPNLLAALGEPHEGVEFRRAPIHVARFRVRAADVYQTIYFPDSAHSLYRASITGNLLIAEFINAPSGGWQAELERAFGAALELAPLGEVRQQYGKIARIDDAARRALVLRLTDRYRIFSLGRFATWRNLLLDDVVDDIGVIRRLLDASDYDRKLKGASI